MTSLGDELCLYIQSQAVGTPNLLNFNGAGTINLFSTLLPDQPDLGVAVIERGGLPPLRTLTGGPSGHALTESKFDQPTVMIRVRSGMNQYVVGNDYAQLVYKTLQGIYEVNLNGPGSMFFHLITALQYPTYLGRDTKERHLWSQNFRVWIENDQR